MSETSAEKYDRLRGYYGELDDADKILFWAKFAVAPVLIFGSTVAAFGWPAVGFWMGVFLWKFALL